jgi:hypothetical protein
MAVARKKAGGLDSLRPFATIFQVNSEVLRLARRGRGTAIVILPVLLLFRLYSCIFGLLIIIQEGADLILRRLMDAHHLRALVGLWNGGVAMHSRRLGSRVVVDCLHLGHLIWCQVEFFSQELNLMLFPFRRITVPSLWWWPCLTLWCGRGILSYDRQRTERGRAQRYKHYPLH